MNCTQQKSWLDNLHYPKTERYKDLKKALKFLKSIKIPLRESPPHEPHPKSFFQWVWIENGTIVYRKAKVDVGQLLHEAGHLALTPPSRRSLITPSKIPPGPSCGDLAVEAWDYYAAIAADIFPMIVFAKDFDNKGLQVYTQLTKKVHYGYFLLKEIGFLEGDCMVRWQMGETDELQNLEAKIAMLSLPKRSIEQL